MFLMKSILIRYSFTALIFLEILCVDAQTSVSRNDFRNCEWLANETRIAISGWPFHLNCNNLVGNNENPSLYQCFISSRHLTTELSGSEIKLTSDETLTLSLIFNNGTCWNKSIDFQVRSTSSRPLLDEIENDYSNNISIVYKKTVIGQGFVLACLPPSTDGIQSANNLALPEGYTATWWRTQMYENRTLARRKFIRNGIPFMTNYTHFVDDLDSAQVDNTRYPSPQTIQIYRISYYDPAVYSCLLRYNGTTAFITHQALCVENEVIDNSPPVIVCTEHFSFVSGENITVSCSVHSSNVMIHADQLKVNWRRESSNNSDCSYRYENSNPVITTDSRYSCSLNDFENLGVKCFRYVPTPKEVGLYPEKKNFVVTFAIKNLKKDDAGKYFVQLQYRNRISKEEFFYLEFNPKNELKKLVIILSSILAVLLCITIAVLCVWWNWIQFQLFLRRHFGKYDEDGKPYVAILSYVYSDDLPELTRKRTRDIVKNIQEKMKDMNYSFYDSHRYFDQGSSVENLLKYLNESHRMIVILTDAYVDERWTRFEAQQGFMNMLKNRTKLIFIRTPGAKKALNECKRKGDDFSSELFEAMKASRNIRWTDKMSATRFKDHVQYALPNLRRFHSDKESSGQFVRFENFERSVSRQTQVSTISSLADPDEDTHFTKSSDHLV